MRKKNIVVGSLTQALQVSANQRRATLVTMWAAKLAGLIEATLEVMYQKGQLVGRMISDPADGLGEDGLIWVAERLQVSIESLKDPYWFTKTFCPPGKQGYEWNKTLDYEIHLTIARHYQRAIVDFGSAVKDHSTPGQWLQKAYSNRWGTARLNAELGLYYGHDLVAKLSSNAKGVEEIVTNQADAVNPVVSASLKEKIGAKNGGSNGSNGRSPSFPKPLRGISFTRDSTTLTNGNGSNGCDTRFDEDTEINGAEGKRSFEIVIRWPCEAASKQEAEEELFGRIEDIRNLLPGVQIEVNDLAEVFSS